MNFIYIKSSLFPDKIKEKKREKKKKIRQNSHYFSDKRHFVKIQNLCVCKIRFKNTKS